jgi:regulator of sigma E protease
VVNDAQGAREVKIAVSSDSAALTEPGRLLGGLGIVPWRPSLPAVVGKLTENGPAERAGLVPGDQILALNDVALAGWDELVRELLARPGETVVLEIMRDIRPRRIDVTLGSRDVGGDSHGFLGIELQQPDDLQTLWGDMLVPRTMAPLPAFSHAVGETVGSSVLMLKMFYQMLIGNVSVKNISGPISIAQYAGVTAQDGPVYYLRFLALLSLSLGVLNLLPIPMLDGGQIVYQMAEAVKGSPVSMRTEIIGQQIGMVMLILLMGFAVFQDIGRFAGS